MPNPRYNINALQSWNDLSQKDKADLAGMFVKSGVYNLSQMKDLYEKVNKDTYSGGSINPAVVTANLPSSSSDKGRMITKNMAINFENGTIHSVPESYQHSVNNYIKGEKFARKVNEGRNRDFNSFYGPLLGGAALAPAAIGLASQAAVVPGIGTYGKALMDSAFATDFVNRQTNREGIRKTIDLYNNGEYLKGAGHELLDALDLTGMSSIGREVGRNAIPFTKKAINSIKDYNLEHNRNLIATHTMTDYNLLRAEEQGGLANPSLAIRSIKRHNLTPLIGYGNIELIAKNNLVTDNIGTKTINVYSGDGWTGVYPTTYKVLSPKGKKAIEEETANFPYKSLVNENTINANLNGAAEDELNQALNLSPVMRTINKYINKSYSINEPLLYTYLYKTDKDLLGKLIDNPVHRSQKLADVYASKDFENYKNSILKKDDKSLFDSKFLATYVDENTGKKVTELRPNTLDEISKYMNTLERFSKEQFASHMYKTSRGKSVFDNPYYNRDEGYIPARIASQKDFSTLKELKHHTKNLTNSGSKKAEDKAKLLYKDLMDSLTEDFNKDYSFNVRFISSIPKPKFIDKSYVDLPKDFYKKPYIPDIWEKFDSAIQKNLSENRDLYNSLKGRFNSLEYPNMPNLSTKSNFLMDDLKDILSPSKKNSYYYEGKLRKPASLDEFNGILYSKDETISPELQELFKKHNLRVETYDPKIKGDYKRKLKSFSKYKSRF